MAGAFAAAARAIVASVVVAPPSVVARIVALEAVEFEKASGIGEKLKLLIFFKNDGYTVRNRRLLLG